LATFNFTVQTEFDIDFGNGETARCFALEPPEKPTGDFSEKWKDGRVVATSIPWVYGGIYYHEDDKVREKLINFHMAPEIFVSDGTPDSIVGKWVAKRDGIGGIHHLAYQVPSVKAQMDLWKEKGFAEFTTEDPLTCPGLTQVFTKTSARPCRCHPRSDLG
jgi:hypothetical protein